MTKKLQKSFQDYLAKIKNPNPSLQITSNSLSSKKKWFLSGCKHPKAPSFALDHDQNVVSHEDASNKGVAATLADVDRFLFENFKSLYIQNGKENSHYREDEQEKGREYDQVWNCGSELLSFESPRFTDPPPDVWRSHRFFVDTGSSSSLIEEARSSLTNTSEDMGSTSTLTNTLNDSTNCNDTKNASTTSDTKDVILPSDCIAVLEYSSEPSHDFLQSMQGMVEARLQQCGKVEWDYLTELLLCYMNLNDKKSHKYILSAFVDLMVGLRRNLERGKQDVEKKCNLRF